MYLAEDCNLGAVSKRYTPFRATGVPSFRPSSSQDVIFLNEWSQTNYDCCFLENDVSFTKCVFRNKLANIHRKILKFIPLEAKESFGEKEFFYFTKKICMRNFVNDKMRIV